LSRPGGSAGVLESIFLLIGEKPSARRIKV
jgi:hypothetical protein